MPDILCDPGGRAEQRFHRPRGGGECSPGGGCCADERACLAFGWICSVPGWQAPKKTPVCVCVCVSLCICAITSERACQLVLPSERTWAPSEKGILHLWVGGLVAHLLGWG